MCHSPMKKTKPKQMQCRKNGALIETKVVESIKGHENILTSYLKRKKQGEKEDREVLGFEYEYRIVLEEIETFGIKIGTFGKIFI